MVHIAHALGNELRNSAIVGVGVGVRTTGYHEIQFYPAVYDASFLTFVIHFDFTVRVDSTLIQPTITLRYYKADSSHVDVDTTVSLFTFPYASASVVATSSNIPGQRNHFLDADREGDLLYLLTTRELGEQGLYVYDLVHGTADLLFNYGTGYHIAADSIYVFCEMSQNRIQRYNTITHTVDLEFPSFAPSGYSNIWGLDTFEGLVYVLSRSQLWWHQFWIKKFTMGGVLLDSVSYDVWGYSMTIHDSIVYCLNVSLSPRDPRIPHPIHRFDLRTMQFLSDVISPARSLLSIKIVDGWLYYCDEYKNVVGALPVSDLLTVRDP